MVEKPTCRKCGAVIVDRNDTGRPAVFCSPACRRAAEYELRRVQVRLQRLEDEAEACRRDRSGLVDLAGATRDERAEDIAREIQSAEHRLRELLAGGE